MGRARRRSVMSNRQYALAGERKALITETARPSWRWRRAVGTTGVYPSSEAIIAATAANPVRLAGSGARHPTVPARLQACAAIRSPRSVPTPESANNPAMAHPWIGSMRRSIGRVVRVDRGRMPQVTTRSWPWHETVTARRRRRRSGRGATRDSRFRRFPVSACGCVRLPRFGVTGCRGGGGASLRLRLRARSPHGSLFHCLRSKARR